MDTPILKIYTDYVCPWCYLSHARLKKTIKNYNIKTQIIHFPLHPDTPDKGRNLLNLFQCNSDELKQKNIMMGQLMKEENLEYSYREFTYNSRLAQELGYWAEIKYENMDIHDKIYEAYFKFKLNINDKEILLNIISNLNLPKNEAKDVLSKRVYKNEIDKHWQLSYKVGVTGVPTYILNKNYLIGAQDNKNFESLFHIENIALK